VPHSSRERLLILAREAVIPTDMADSVARLVGFRNVLLHRHQEIDMHSFHAAIDFSLDRILDFSQLTLGVPER